MKNKKFILAVICSLLFVINTVLVVCDFTGTIDTVVHEIIFSINCSFMDVVMKTITFFASDIMVVFIMVLAMLFFIVNGEKLKAVFTGTTVGTSMLLYLLFNTFIARPRPEYISIVEKRFSYPSGHTTASITLYGILLYMLLSSKIESKYKKIIKGICIFFMIAVPISRLYLGCHYVTDIFGGITLASTVLFLSLNLFEELKEVKK